MLKPILLILAVLILISCKTTTYFVVRHAEKAENTMTSDVPLSEAGQQRAVALKDALKNKHIGTIYSTNYLRTRSTAQPLATEVGITIQTYDPSDSTFVNRITHVGNQDKDGNILIIGHSNTVDDIVNKLVGERIIQGDLSDSEYGDLFVVKQRGRKFTMQRRRFGP